ncbi:hypothetical protein FH972_003266 [Carpinus fangiana]|uniref:Uncharacterized protein n=1 Tax=Carpinus fangiana TaxID=176857 RepID=A0A5N6QHZ6_9ROSI|nr:hypothetical protein FH972_003266 [Carpinus fangiana]
MYFMRLYALPIIGFMFLALLLRLSHAQALAPSPASSHARRTHQLLATYNCSSSLIFNPGSAIDQGIAYILLLVALAITYLVH